MYSPEGEKFNRIIPDAISVTRFGKIKLTLLVVLLLSIGKQTNGQELLLQIPATSEECYLRSFLFSDEWPVLYLGEENGMPSLENCVGHCKTSTMSDLCTAVAYAEDTRKCMLLRFGFEDENIGAVSAGYQSFYVIEDCYRALELTCEVEITVGEGSARGVKSVEIRTDVPSLEQCLTVCKVFEETTLCMGVHYSFLEHTCKLMVSDAQLRSGYKIGPDESLAVLKSCVERPTEESRNHTILIELPILSESCELDVIEQARVGGVESVSLHEGVESLSACVTLCKLLESQACVGVHYAHWSEICNLIAREENNHGLYYPVGENEIFAFIKTCRTSKLNACFIYSTLLYSVSA
ncbi:PAN 1 domain containing protein [Trichuris trichiura]|uniref:PAN 1 domain containing protein n=1 Tax=Trichuris trichiura TaxID=36087 RepID=A0A077ZB73_TRITR|nr:PAN 1 domain containing protein [Trichuris trichiura]